MSLRGSSERMAFLRREIARIEAGGAAQAAARLKLAPRGRSGLAAVLAPARLVGGLHEIVPAAAPDCAAALGLGLRLAVAVARAEPAKGVILALEDFMAQEHGAPYGPGLAEAGVDAARLVIVRTHSPAETLRAMEEALKCSAVAAVLAETGAPDRLYGLDASRRLALAARAGGGAGFLVPLALAGGGERLTSAAATRLEALRRNSAAEAFGASRLALPGLPVVGLRILKSRGLAGLDPARVHEIQFQQAFNEVAFDAFSFDPPALPDDRPHQAGARVRVA